MRQLTSFFIILMMLLAPLRSLAQQSTVDRKPRPPITLTKSNAGGRDNRPKSPDRQSITCAYDGMVMELNFTVSEGISTLTVTDETSQFFSYNIDTSSLFVSVPVGLLSGSVSIELETERGNHFYGVIE